MELYVISFKGDLVVQADSEKAARKKAEQWTSSLEDRIPDPSMPEITAVNISISKDHGRKAALRKGSTQDDTAGDKKVSKKPGKK